jgi:hypothetical protein
MPQPELLKQKRILLEINSLRIHGNKEKSRINVQREYS